jgi:WD40 repeat protein
MKSNRLFIAALVCLGSGTAQARMSTDEILTFNASGKFSNGDALGGTVTIDVTTGTVTTAAFTATGPDPQLFNSTIGQASNTPVAGDTEIAAYSPTNGGVPTLVLSVPTSSFVGYLGGTLGSNTMGANGFTSAYFFNDGSNVTLVSGSLTSIPEPTSLVCSASALAMASLFYLWRRKGPGRQYAAWPSQTENQCHTISSCYVNNKLGKYIKFHNKRMKIILIFTFLLAFFVLGCNRADRSGRVEPVASVKLPADASSIDSIAFSPTGSTLATAGAKWVQRHTFYEVILRDTVSLGIIRTIPIPKHIEAISFSPDGKAIAVADGAYQGLGSTRLFDPATGARLKVIGGSTGWIHGLAFSPDGGLLVTCGSTWNDRASGYDSGKVTTRDLANGTERLGEKWNVGTCRAVAFAPSGQTYITGGGMCSLDRPGSGSLCLWDAATGQPLWIKQGHESVVECVAFAPDEKVVASGGMDGVLKLWNAVGGEELYVARIEGNRYGRVLSVAYSPDGKYLAAGRGSYNRGDHWGELRVWEIGAKPIREISIIDNTCAITSVTFSPDGGLLAAGDADGTLRLWDTKKAFAVPLHP